MFTCSPFGMPFEMLASDTDRGKLGWEHSNLCAFIGENQQLDVVSNRECICLS